MVDEPWRKAVDELDVEIVAAQDIALGGAWPAIAVALTLIDAGLIDRGRMLDIIESLHDLAVAEAEPGRAEEQTPKSCLRKRGGSVGAIAAQAWALRSMTGSSRRANLASIRRARAMSREVAAGLRK